MLKCAVCGHEEPDFLGQHLLEAHGLTSDQYVAQHAGALVASERLIKLVKTGTPERKHPPAADSLCIKPHKMFSLPVNIQVPATACLPMPDHYRLPSIGQLAKDVEHALTALWKGRTMYIWGLSGSGKDALFHWYSAATRTPALERQIKPGADIQSWFYNRGFNKDGTSWEEGPLLKALRDGYEIRDASGTVVKRIPYLILFTDFDRVDRSQAEHLRLILDSIQGRVEGPEGRTWPVLKGTRIVATGNTAGSGDSRGRYTSAGVMDASLMERFDRVFKFTWMDWVDEAEILQDKFPVILKEYPGLIEPLGRVVMALRTAILKDELFAEFSHRSACTVLGHAQDCLEARNDKKALGDKSLLTVGFRPWLDRLPDDVAREFATKLMDPHVKGGML